MAFVPGYKYDVFISYAQQNNEDEWVSHLRHELKRLVYSKLGHKGDDFFFDAKLDRHGSTSTELFEAVASSAVLLVVLSDAYKGKLVVGHKELLPGHAAGTNTSIQRHEQLRIGEALIARHLASDLN